MRGGGFIAMSWYKSRGRIEIMTRVDGDPISTPLTVAEAEAAIENIQIDRAIHGTPSSLAPI